MFERTMLLGRACSPDVSLNGRVNGAKAGIVAAIPNLRCRVALLRHAFPHRNTDGYAMRQKWT
jgi:hypothetical protein